MNNKMKRFLSMLLSLALIISIVPAPAVTAFADELVTDHAEGCILGETHEGECQVEEPAAEPKVCAEGCILTGEEHEECKFEETRECAEGCILKGEEHEECKFDETR